MLSKQSINEGSALFVASLLAVTDLCTWVVDGAPSVHMPRHTTSTASELL